MKIKDFFTIIILTILFSLIIFLIKTYFFSGVAKNAEEQYIDRSLFLEIEPNIQLESVNNNTQNEELVNNSSFDISSSTGTINNDLSEKNKENLNVTTYKENNTENKSQKNNFYFDYIPSDFASDINLQSYILKKLLLETVFNDKIVNLGVEFNKIIYDVRGKMKDGKVKLFGVKKLGNSELVSVFIHEFAHYLDIYYLDKNSFGNIDPSYYFYNIAWESTKISKKGLSQKDFVSGYAMTNKYEDFAESFAYYVLHNSDFKEKTKSSDILTKKYNFFGDYLFKNKEFQKNDFGNGDKIKDYYRDITKIDINLENFLQYLQKSI
nr:putative zinc-binding metallopeptidase [Candidatus Gracilibacteria bacterium]